MKGKLSKVYRSGLAMLMALIMVLGCTPVNVFADAVTESETLTLAGIEDVTDDGKITYVTFGDSVTNGYGMTGYRYNDGTNVLGFRREVAGSYPAEIKEYFIADAMKQGYSKEDAENLVNLEQMAISGFRMDELHWMLCDDYEPDYYHTDYFKNWNKRCFNYLSKSTDPEAVADFAYFTENYGDTYTVEQMIDANNIYRDEKGNTPADKIIMTEYRKAVDNADFITIDLGTNNFGTFLTSTISSILVTGKIDTNEVNNKTQFSHYMDANSAATLEGMIDQMAAGMAGVSSGMGYDLVRTLARCMMFGYLGFVNNYDGALDAIYAINEDVNVLVIDMYSMITGVQLVGGALGDQIDLDELYNMFVDMANFYANELSPYAQKVTHVSLPQDPALLIDDYAEYFYPENQGALVAIPQRDENGDLIYQKDENGNIILDAEGNPIPVINDDYNPTAVTLLHEFIMESTKGADGAMLDPDDPADREEFNQKIGNKVKLLDTYVYDLQGVIRDKVVREQILSGIHESIQPIEMAIDALDLIYMAIEGVAAARAGVEVAVEKVPVAIQAVDTAIAGVATAEEAVDTAVSSVALAQTIVDLLLENLIDHETYGEMFQGRSTSPVIKSVILGKIEDYITKDIMIQAGFEPTDANRTALAEEAYEMACVYYENKSDRTNANKLAIIEGLSYMLVKTKGISETEAQKTAELAYELAQMNTNQGRPAAVKAALASEVGEETAELAYQINEIYKAQGKDAAIVAAINTELNDEETSHLAYDLYKEYQANGGVDNHDEAYNAAVLAAVESELPEDTVAGFGMTKAEAAVLAVDIADTYHTDMDVDGATEKAVVSAILVEVAKNLLGLTIESSLAEQGYDLYTGIYKPAVEQGMAKEDAKKKAVLYALETNFASTGEAVEVADAMYAVYKGTANDEQQQLAYITAMQVAGIDSSTAAAIYTCYVTNLNGHYEDDNVKTAICYFMTVALEVDETAAEGLYALYIQYKNVAETLAKISRLKTVYFDTLLTGAIDTSVIAKGIQEGTLVLEEPEEGTDNYEEQLAAFKRDSSLAIFYFRFMAADGVFTHPSIAGHTTFTEVIKNGINNMVPVAEADSDIIITDETSILSIGDAMVAADTKGNYTQLIVDKLGLGDKVTYVQNDVARLEDFYNALVGDAGDAFAQQVVAQAGKINGTALAEEIKANDIILLNVGSMNLGYSVLQLGTYQSTNGSTYAMNFADKDSMSGRNLGKRLDDFLKGFQNSTGVTQSATAAGMIMLLFESYSYGLTSFTNDFNKLMDIIHTLNPDATIILTGIGDIAGDAYYATADENGNVTAYLALGDFYQSGAEILNGHMEKYAVQTANVFYMDTMDAENPATQREVPLNVAANSDALGGLLNDAHFTTKGHATVASKFDCANFGVHFMKDSSVEATCTNGGKIETGCEICKLTESTDVEPLGHSYGTPEWNWEGFETATATFTCTRPGCEHIETVEATITHETVDAGCVDGGQTVYTATASIDGTPYYNEKADLIAATGHKYGQPVWTWNEELTEATATFACTVENCDSKATAVASADAIVTTVTKEATCVETGTKDVTATVTFQENEYTDKKEGVTILATGVHNYEDGECTMCGDIEHKVDCTYKEETTLKAGELTLSLGGTEVGTYAFEEVNGGWAIKDANGYLALTDGTLTTSNTPFVWTYANGMFSANVTTEETSENWWNNIFGGILGGILGGGNTTTTTYYLVVSGTTLTVSTETTGAEAAFYVYHNDGDANHAYVETVVEATCTTDGYTLYTCTKCGTSYTKNIVPAAGHDYISTVTASTCTTPGYTEYKCNNCGDTYRGEETPATGHNFVDGACTVCGEGEEGECVGTKETSLTSGLTAQLVLNGTNVGTFTFAQVDGGWTIRAIDGTYLGKDGSYTNEAFVWTYSNNSFSYSVSTQTSSNGWLGNIFGGFLGGILGGNKTETTTYYLVASNGVPAVSTSSALVTFLVEVVGEHEYGNPVSKDGMHVYTCTVCGYTKSVVCTDDNCTLCHPTEPEVPVAKVNVSVSVTKTEEKEESDNWFSKLLGGMFGGSSSTKTTYTATINVTAEGTEVKKVEYSTDGVNWTEGTSFTSDSEINKFYVRVTGTNTVVYEFTYMSGTVTEGIVNDTTPDKPVVPDDSEDDDTSSGKWWENIFGGFGNWFK